MYPGCSGYDRSVVSTISVSTLTSDPWHHETLSFSAMPLPGWFFLFATSLSFLSFFSFFSLSLWWLSKIEIPVQFVNYPDELVWHQRPSHGQGHFNPLSPIFWCSLWTSGSPFNKLRLCHLRVAAVGLACLHVVFACYWTHHHVTVVTKSVQHGYCKRTDLSPGQQQELQPVFSAVSAEIQHKQF